MKNRVKLLCLKNDILTPHDLALAIGIGDIRAKAIWEETCIIDFEIVKRLSNLFKVSTAYILCQTENEA